MVDIGLIQGLQVEGRSAFDTWERPIFVLCVARSGSTLLRVLLDSHNEICCPPELNLADAFRAHERVHEFLRMGDEALLASCRDFTDKTVRPYAEGRGKTRWCEKSLLTAKDAHLIERIFPGAQFICLFRECLDTICSGLEASPFGFAAYGYLQYAAASPENTVMALARYWTENTEHILEFQRNNPDKCIRVRYEDLVNDAEGEMAKVYRFLRIDPLNASDWRQRLSHGESVQRFGPSDHKVWYTGELDGRSIGHGWALPVELIPPLLQDRINQIHADLKYPSLKADISESLVRTMRPEVATEQARLASEQLYRSLAALLESDQLRTPPLCDDSPAIKVKLVLPTELQPWVIDLHDHSIRRADESTSCTIVSEAETLLAIARSDLNVGSAIGNCRLRVLSGDDEGTDSPESQKAAAQVFEHFVFWLRHSRMNFDSLTPA